MAYLDALLELHGDRLRTHVSSDGSPLSVPELVGSVDHGTELYMCGPIRLMDAVRRSWVERELPLPNLRFETFGNSGWYSAQEFVVRVPKLDLEVTVGADQTMLEALEAAGADMMYDCRKGECGLCEVRVLTLEGDLDHRDVFYSERQKDARSKLCCCVSRAVVPVGFGGQGVRLDRRVVTDQDGIVDVSPTPPACRRDTADAARSSAPSRSPCAGADRPRRRTSAPCSGRAGWRGTRRARPGRAGIRGPG